MFKDHLFDSFEDLSAGDVRADDLHRHGDVIVVELARDPRLAVPELLLLGRDQFVV